MFFLCNKKLRGGRCSLESKARNFEIVNKNKCPHPYCVEISEEVRRSRGDELEVGRSGGDE